MISKLISKLGYTRFIALSFIPVILLGTFLLCLPISSKTGEWTNFIDSLLYLIHLLIGLFSDRLLF